MSNEQDRRTIFRLQDELRKMTAWGRGLETEFRLAKEANATLQAENQRLRAAGDAMASRIEFDSKMEDEDWGVNPRTPDCVKAWLAAKGVQP